MADYRIHIALDHHEGCKTGQVRSVTRGTRINGVPEGEFKDLQPGKEYSRIDKAPAPVQASASEADSDPDDSPLTDSNE